MGDDEQGIEQDVALLRERLGILEGIQAALERWPEVATLAWASESTEALVADLAELLGIDGSQAQVVADLQVRGATRERRASVADQIRSIEEQLARAAKPRRR